LVEVIERVAALEAETIGNVPRFFSHDDANISVRLRRINAFAMAACPALAISRARWKRKTL